MTENAITAPTAAPAASSQAAPACCPVCQSLSVEDFFHLPRLPIHVGMVYESAALARCAPMGQLTLAYCDGCGFVFNRAFEPEKLVFTPGYEVQLVHSPVFASFLTELTARLVDRYHLHGKDLIDIGCGAGHFLQRLCEAGGNRGLGIDPTLAREGPVALSSGQIRLLRGLFGDSDISDWQYDLATCQSVLEDVADPVAFLVQVRRVLEARAGHAYLEVFNALRAFEAGEVWSLTYEQCNYYSLASFSEAIRRAGFRIIESGTCYGDGQYLYVEASSVGAPASAGLSAANGRLKPELERPAAVMQFSSAHRQRLAYWQQQIDSFRASGKQAAVWGTGGKGICFLNTVEAQDVFAWAVDINPDRQNRYVPGSGQPIVSPTQLRSLRPDAVVITNPLYESEIRNAVAELDLDCDFLTI
jgi:SAM-dependent methyltransferase